MEVRKCGAYLVAIGAEAILPVSFVSQRATEHEVLAEESRHRGVVPAVPCVCVKALHQAGDA
jgi:hypothetical protein